MVLFRSVLTERSTSSRIRFTTTSRISVRFWVFLLHGYGAAAPWRMRQWRLIVKAGYIHAKDISAAA